VNSWLYLTFFVFNLYPLSMAGLSADQERLAISRLYSRFGFGPRPGEFQSAVNRGFDATCKTLLIKPTAAQLSEDVLNLIVDDLGPRPTPGTFANTEYSLKIRAQIKEITLWWLDQMATTDFPLNEKLTWFWHGHWATSIEKLNFALPMYKQNITFRNFALGNFSDFSKAMYQDGALQFWLDGQENTAKAPNENLSREFMELFTLGVGRYTEEDVRSLAKVFTGIQVNRQNGQVYFNARRHDSSAVTLLGVSKVFSADDAISFITARDDSSRFIFERLWFRFISSNEEMPSQIDRTSFASRQILDAVTSLARSPYMSNPSYVMVKSPVEWFIGLCRAFSITPSKTTNSSGLLGGLVKLAQYPFAPPNVGGWPAGELWLTSASTQFRLSLSQLLMKNISLRDLESIPAANRSKYLQDLLGVYQWSVRTSEALNAAKRDPERMLLLAINSPEYVVGA